MKDLEAVRQHIEILRWCKQRRAEITELENQAKDIVQAALGDDDTGTLDGKPVIAWKTHKRTALDQKHLKASFGDVFAECQTTSEVRRFEVLE